jgi:hypothetical protein
MPPPLTDMALADPVYSVTSVEPKIDALMKVCADLARDLADDLETLSV